MRLVLPRIHFPLAEPGWDALSVLWRAVGDLSHGINLEPAGFIAISPGAQAHLSAGTASPEEISLQLPQESWSRGA